MTDVRAALGLLSRLPLADCPVARQRGARAAWAWPLAGAAIGGLAGLAGMLALGLGLPPALAAMVSLGALVMLGGAMHEDGLADTADAVWGGHSVERRLEIMKDSHLGSYGVIALVLSLGARWAALWLLFDQAGGSALAAILAAAMLSRAAMTGLCWALPNARGSGLAHDVGRAEPGAVLLAAGIAGLATLALLGLSAPGAIFWAVVVTVGMGALARARIGGQTGDVLGATQQVVEIAALLSILA